MVAKRVERVEDATQEPARRRFTVTEYERMIQTGVLYDGERVELLDGEIVCMAAIGAQHAACVSDVQDWFGARLQGRAKVRTQQPIRLPTRSEPEPDIAIVRWHADSYRTAHPGPADVLLLIEVAATSLRIDRERKLPLYAAARIPEVWIVDLDTQRVLVHRTPRGRRYTSILTVRRGGTLTPAAFPDLTLTLDDVLGPAA